MFVGDGDFSATTVDGRPGVFLIASAFEQKFGWLAGWPPSLGSS